MALRRISQTLAAMEDAHRNVSTVALKGRGVVLLKANITLN
jgi:hypothetical protein